MCLGILNTLHISDVSCLALFAWFALSTGGAILFYHHLQVLFHPFFICISFNFPEKFEFLLFVDKSLCGNSVRSQTICLWKLYTILLILCSVLLNFLRDKTPELRNLRIQGTHKQRARRTFSYKKNPNRNNFICWHFSLYEWQKKFLRIKTKKRTRARRISKQADLIDFHSHILPIVI